jgi:hypothetical protein
MSTWGPEELAEVFLHDVPPEIASAAERFDGAPSPDMFSSRGRSAHGPRYQPACSPPASRLAPLAFQRRVTRERLGLEVEVIPGGHLPLLARPAELADRPTAVTRVGDRRS